MNEPIKRMTNEELAKMVDEFRAEHLETPEHKALLMHISATKLWFIVEMIEILLRKGSAIEDVPAYRMELVEAQEILKNLFTQMHIDHDKNHTQMNLNNNPDPKTYGES